MTISRLLSWSILSMGCLAAVPAAAIEYDFAVLSTAYGQPPGGASETAAYAINNTGQIAGWSHSPESVVQRATVWNNLAPAAIAVYPGLPRSQALGLNDGGLLVGFSTPHTAALPQLVTLWYHGPVTELDPQGGNDAQATDINDRGEAVGASNSASSQWRRATQWNGYAAVDLGTLGGLASEAQAINNLSQVVGSADTAAGQSHAALWQEGRVTDLGTLGGTSSRAFDINEAGKIVGWSTLDGAGGSRATLWDGAAMTDLGTLAGNFSSARAINEAGDIVGESSDGNDGLSATLWDDGVAIDLNSFLDPGTVAAGWRLSSAWDINDHGAIVGTAVNGLSGARAGYVLTPIPEPAGIVLMLAGLGLLGGVSRRIRRQA